MGSDGDKKIQTTISGCRSSFLCLSTHVSRSDGEGRYWDDRSRAIQHLHERDGDMSRTS
jgi:hypothetical protein